MSRTRLIAPQLEPKKFDWKQHCFQHPLASHQFWRATHQQVRRKHTQFLRSTVLKWTQPGSSGVSWWGLRICGGTTIQPWLKTSPRALGGIQVRSLVCLKHIHVQHHPNSTLLFPACLFGGKGLKASYIPILRCSPTGGDSAQVTPVCTCVCEYKYTLIPVRSRVGDLQARQDDKKYNFLVILLIFIWKK